MSKGPGWTMSKSKERVDDMRLTSAFMNKLLGEWIWVNRSDQVSDRINQIILWLNQSFDEWINRRMNESNRQKIDK